MEISDQPTRASVPRPSFNAWRNSGAPWIWLNAGAISISLIVVLTLLGLLTVRGLSHFWPATLHEYRYQLSDGTQERIIGQQVNAEFISVNQYRESTGQAAPAGAEQVERWLIKVGNRELLPADFRWLDHHLIKQIDSPVHLVRIERTEWGDMFGTLQGITEAGQPVATGSDASWLALQPRLERAKTLRAEIRALEKGEIGAINHQLERLRLERRKLALQNQQSDEALADIKTREDAQHAQFELLQQRLIELHEQLARDTLQIEVMTGQVVDVPLSRVIEATRPNSLSLFSKLQCYAINLWNFLSDDPREANTEGGIFPAIFGTVMMVMLMSVMVTPFGIVTAVYMREYARQGPLIRAIRIAVNNLAGVPSIVYGVFGLGFFVYLLGGQIDQWFFAEALPAPTLGTPGILWASLTLALLTVPVVIVSTEEGLARIPRSIREGSLAVGATRFETLWRVVLPMASPAIMTGMILAIARAAGEVAPLMLVGVVKLAPTMPIDGNFPFFHLDRKFMHLGFHIYDVGFQSPNVEAARPLVYATSFFLVLVIILLNVTVILLRNRLREKFSALDN